MFICLDDKISSNEKLSFFKWDATDVVLLKEWVEKKKYDGIVNLIHYPKTDDYTKVHPTLIKNCEHLIFLSSYRVYADLQHPITEQAPKLLDVSSDESFLRTGEYSVSSGQALTWEDYAQLYHEIAGLKFTWVSDREYMRITNNYNYYALIYDRFFDRKIDNSKILQATGLTQADFAPVREGLKFELENYRKDHDK